MHQEDHLGSEESRAKLQEHVGTMLEAARTILKIVIHLCEDKKMFGAFWVRPKASRAENKVLITSNSSLNITPSARLPLFTFLSCNAR